MTSLSSIISCSKSFLNFKISFANEKKSNIKYIVVAVITNEMDSSIEVNIMTASLLNAFLVKCCNV